MRQPSSEIDEGQALLADIERQITLQQQLMEICRAKGRPTRPVSRKLQTQMAERRRDHIRFLSRTSEACGVQIPASLQTEEPPIASPLVQSPGAWRLNPGRWICLLTKTTKRWMRSAS